MSATVSPDGYDVIGDVHGHATRLDALLRKLGYDDATGVFRHPRGRRVVFVGDLIDRGAEQVRTVTIARSMVEAGTALMVLGNHEVNAIAYATPTADGGEFLRPHSEKHAKQHRAFLDEFGFGTAAHREVLDWFRTQPLWRELDGALRVVHACWDPAAIAGLGNPVLDDGTFVAAHPLDKNSPAYWWVEHLCKGPELKLPCGHQFKDGDGNGRDPRIRWWLGHARTNAELSELPAHAVECFSGEDWWHDPPKPEHQDENRPLVPAYTDPIPVIFGHYWRHPDSTPESLVHGRPVCVDLSAGKGGPLVAYRWSGESIADPANLVGAGGRWDGVTADRA